MTGPRHLLVLWMFLMIAYEVKLSAAIDCSLTDCYEGDLGVNYRGSKSNTRSGLKCQEWASQEPHSHRFNPASFQSQDLVSNHCRNPDGEPEGPWCYTITSKRWEYCLPKCRDNMGPSAVTYGTEWFCAVKGTTVVKVAKELKVARKALAEAGWGQSQAIIPMTAVSSGDPHSLAKNWEGGNMWWYNWPDINNMQGACRSACSMITTTRAPTTTTNPATTKGPMITTTRAPTTTTKPATTKGPICDVVFDMKRKRLSRAPKGWKPAYIKEANVPQEVANQGQAKIEEFCADKCVTVYRGYRRCRMVRAGCTGDRNIYWGERPKTNCKCNFWFGIGRGGDKDNGGTWFKCRK